MQPIFKQLLTLRVTMLFMLVALLALPNSPTSTFAQPHFQQPAPALVLPDRAGKQVDLRNFRNNYVVVDFWASWCPPCRVFNRTLVKLYKRFHPMGLEVLSVSLDEDRKSWLRAIRTDGLAWTQLVDTMAWNSKVATAWDVLGVPNSFLIDPEGNIIARNLHGGELEKKLEEIYKKEKP
jgi:thiol-disulfide isomerase/thioredoxin